MNIGMYLKIVLVFVVLAVLAFLVTRLMVDRKSQENFKTCPYKNVHPDVIAKDYIADTEEKLEEAEEEEDKLGIIIDKLDEHKQHDDEYVKKTNVELAAKSAAGQYCPVPPDFDLTQYVKKTEMNDMVKCPKVPDMRDFVLKSSIPPASKCPSCICPKVKVSAGFCKKCPTPEEICPKPAPCGIDQCKNIIKCPPCPVPPRQKPLKCPPPQPCPTPPPCKEGGRCPPNQCPKCKYYGIKTVESTKSIEEMLNDLVNGDDKDKLAKLNALRNLLGVRLEEEKVKCEHNKNHNKKKSKPKPSNVDSEVNQPTTMASEPEDKSYLKPVVDYDNKCVDNTLFYSAEGILGSDFN